MKAIVCSLALMCATGSAFAAVDFELVDGTNSPIVPDNIPNVTSNGFVFTGEHFHAISDPNLAGTVGNESRTWIGHEGGSLGRVITMQPAAGGLFDILGFDGAEQFLNDSSVDYPNATHIRVVGTFADDSTIQADFELDGIGDGRGGVDDFQHFILTGFVGLKSATFNGIKGGEADFGFSVDNIDTIPGPASAMCLAIGGVMVSRRRR